VRPRLAHATVPALAVLAVAGCASLGSGMPSAAPSRTALCTTRACIVSDVQKSLVSIVAKDNSVITKALCKPSSVKHNPGNTWTVTCAVTYSDGKRALGYANLLPAQDKITFEPLDVSGP
jgi:hypothetical protein